MAAKAENRMNLSALQQRDPYITDIVDTASQVALYSFSSKSNEWAKTEIEGTLFVYTRTASPTNGFMILNRLGLHDLIEPLTRSFEFQLQDPFLLYKNAQSVINGIWFYDKDECARIGQLMNSLVQIAIESRGKTEITARQRRASESDTMLERTSVPTTTILDTSKNVDILQMLSKAQDEYDKSKVGPKPMIDNPNAAATSTKTSIIKPVAVRAPPDQQRSSPDVNSAVAHEPSNQPTQISLEALFRKASLQHGSAVPAPGPPDARGVPKATQLLRSVSLVDAEPSGDVPGEQMPPILKRLMSSQGGTLQEIEQQQQHGDIPRDQMPQPVGAEAPVSGAGPCGVGQQTNPPPQVSLFTTGPQSPDTALKQTLNILPPPPPVSSTSCAHQRSAQTDSCSSGGAAVTASKPKFSLYPEPPLEGHTVQTSVAAEPALIASGDFLKSTTVRPGYTSPQVVPASQEDQVPLPHCMSEPTLLSPMMLLDATRTGSVQTLVTPQALSQRPQSEERNVPLQQSDSSPEVLMTPMVFSKLAGPQREAAPPSLQADTPWEPQEVNPLTKEQLQQALIYMLKNDANFLSRIHEAYVKSLSSSLGPKS